MNYIICHSLSQGLDLRSSDEHVALQNVSICYTRKNIYIYKKNRNNKLKIIASALNDEFQLPDGSYSVSDIQYYIEYIITKHEALTAICPFYVYINAINSV